MMTREEPIITENKGMLEYTMITFEPDLHRFSMKDLNEDIVSLMTKRVYDLAGITPANVKVYLNKKQIDVKNFNSYVDLYLQSEENKELPKIIEKCSSDRWEVICSLSDGQFNQVSFVNSISTIKGGTHVNYIAD
jgi:DNA topoisomerase-2